MAHVLVIGKEIDLHTHLAQKLVPNGHSLTAVSSISEGLQHCGHGNYDLVVVDDNLATETSSCIAHFRTTAASPKVVVVSQYGDPVLGEQALLNGALNYMHKSTAPAAILRLLDSISTSPPADSTRPALSEFGIYGNAPSLQAEFDLIYKSRMADVSVLIQGETGTGKELFAKAIHKLSRRRDGPLVTVDCASLPENLVESLLFGYSQGAFTGAARSRFGLISQADGGTLFLDEVGELPLALQKKFLRVLQERRFRPVGGGQEVRSDFRLIAATNKDLQEMTRQGTFRDDLLYRIRTLKITLPPLRERGDDAIEIAEHILRSRAKEHGVKPCSMSADFKARLKNYDWPGNIRELVNVIESTLAVAQDDQALLAEHLPATTHARMIQSSCLQWNQGSAASISPGDDSCAMSRPSAANTNDEHAKAQSLDAPTTEDAPEQDEVAAKRQQRFDFPTFREGRRDALELFEKDYLEHLYSVAQADIRQACALSNLSRARLYELLRKHRITE